MKRRYIATTLLATLAANAQAAGTTVPRACGVRELYDHNHAAQVGVTADVEDAETVEERCLKLAAAEAPLLEAPAECAPYLISTDDTEVEWLPQIDPDEAREKLLL